MVMLKDKDGEGGQIPQSNPTHSLSDQTQAHPDENSRVPQMGLDLSRNSDSKPSKLGVSQELTLSYLCDNNPKLGVSSGNGKSLMNSFDKIKGKSIVSEDHGDDSQNENRWVERDFLQLSGNSLKREIQSDEISMNRDKKPKLETLDLSLALPDASLPLAGSNRGPPAGSNPTRSMQSLGRTNSSNTQTTFSTDFTGGSMSYSYSYSHQFSHNPSCSLTRNSTENYSMGSHRRDCDQIWNGGEGTNGSVHSRFRPVADGGVSLVQPNRTNSDSNLSFFPSELPARPKIDTQSGDSRGKGSESFKGLEGLDSGKPRKPSRPERILREIVSESIPTMAQILQELPEETIESAKDYLKTLMNSPEKRDEFAGLQLHLEKRSDLTHETLSKAHRNQLEILVSIRTTLDSFLSAQTRLPIIELVEIFSFERCRNVNCKRLLPVEDCDCKICSTKRGFCSECMCPVCLNFDCANNTCSWVGCDVCAHWCHAACGIQTGLIRPGPSLKGPTGTTEMQFHCPCCGHDSEMFGFIKDVFKSCAEKWGPETLVKELECVRRIFRGSEDFKGRELHSKAGEMMSKLEKKAMSPSEVCGVILQFFNYTDGVCEFPASNLPSKAATTSAMTANPRPLQTPFHNTGSSSDAMLAQHGFPLHNGLKPPPNTTPPPLLHHKPPPPPIEDEWSVKSTKKDGFDSVESLVRVKEAEARMFQNRADEARKEAEGYKRMIRTKIEKLDREYTEKIANLKMNETEEKRKRKAEELKASENSHCEYFKMKMRMQAEIAGLLERMENTKKQWV